MKVKIISVILIICFLFSIKSFADDEIEDINKKETIETISNVAEYNKEPNLNSRNAIAIDRNTKKILYDKNSNQKVKMASTTKIMTALTVIQNANLNNIVEVSPKAASIGGSKLKLKSGDKITVRDLLYGLMLRSGNDAAIALAEYIGGSIEGFAELMNENVNNLGLENTHFITPHGLDDDNHYTTAYELALITDYALKNEEFSKIVNTKTVTIKINGIPRVINNTNELLGNLNGVYGVKTGFTNGAGRCLVTAVKRDNMDIISVVLGADTKKDRTCDSVKIIEYAFSNFETINLNKKIDEGFENWNKINNNRINIEKGDGSSLNLKLKDSNEKIEYTILKNTFNNITIDIKVNEKLTAPIKKESTIGKMIVRYNDEIISQLDIINENEISRKRVNDFMEEIFSNYNMWFEKIVR